MTASDFVEIVRKGSDKLRVDNIVLQTGDQEFHGSGTLHVSRDRFKIKMQLNEGERLPEIRMGVFTKRDSWKIAGLIEYTLKFRCDTVSHGPFTDNLAFHAGIVDASWNYPDVLKKASAFFETNSILSKEISTLLFLFREADAKEVHSDITMIAICALFENLVQLLFRELKLEEKAMNEGGTYNDATLESFAQARRNIKTSISQQIWKLARSLFKGKNLDEHESNEADGPKLFKRAQSELGEHIDRQIASECEGLVRMYGVVRSANPFSTPKRFQAVLDHFNFDPKWRKEMEIGFQAWYKARQRLFHDKQRADQSEDALKQDIFDQCQIAGTINVLLLKLMGYSGLMRASTFEGKYQ